MRKLESANVWRGWSTARHGNVHIRRASGMFSTIGRAREVNVDANKGLFEGAFRTVYVRDGTVAEHVPRAWSSSKDPPNPTVNCLIIDAMTGS